MDKRPAIVCSQLVRAPQHEGTPLNERPKDYFAKLLEGRPFLVKLSNLIWPDRRIMRHVVEDSLRLQMDEWCF